MATRKSGSLLKYWDGDIEEWIKVAAKKPQAVEAKHLQIVEGACRVFTRKGFHPSSTREIAEASGMSLGQLYHYISSKDDILFLIHKHMQTMWYRHLVDSKIEAIEGPTKRLELSLRATLHFLSENKDLILFIYSESKYLTKQHLAVILEMDNRNVVGFWRSLLNDALEEQGVVADVEVIANLITYIEVFLPLRGWNLKNTPVKKLEEFLLAFIFKGIGLTRP
jgi:TetR/AcrR family transcriptional regulator, cholesterol catabolism regulator